MKDFHDCWRTESRFFLLFYLKGMWGEGPRCDNTRVFYSFLLFSLPKPKSLFDTVIPGSESLTLCRTQSTERSEWLLSDNSRDALPLSWGEDGWSVSFSATIESYPFHPETSKVFIRVFFVHRTRKQIHLYYYGFSFHFFLVEQALDRHDFHGSAEWHFNLLAVGIFQQEGE